MGMCTRHTYFDEQVKVSEVVVTARRGVATHDLFSIDLSSHLNVLANWQTKHVICVRQSKAVAAELFITIGYTALHTSSTYIAVFGEISVFSTKGNSCHVCESRTGLRSERQT